MVLRFGSVQTNRTAAIYYQYTLFISICRKEVLDEEGWLHTGDIGEWLPGGRLKIIDRSVNVVGHLLGKRCLLGELDVYSSIENM